MECNAYEYCNIAIFTNFRGRYFKNDIEIQHFSSMVHRLRMVECNTIINVDISRKMTEKIVFENGRNCQVRSGQVWGHAPGRRFAAPTFALHTSADLLA